MLKPNSKKKSTKLAWENSPTFLDATTGFPAKWRLRIERRNSILMTRHYPDLGSDVSSEYGISALVSQTSFGGKTTGGVAKCRLFSQATTKFKCAKKWKINITMRKYCWKCFFWMATIPSTESKDRTIFCIAILMLTSPIDITRNILTRSALA